MCSTPPLLNQDSVNSYYTAPTHTHSHHSKLTKLLLIKPKSRPLPTGLSLAAPPTIKPQQVKNPKPIDQSHSVADSCCCYTNRTQQPARTRQNRSKQLDR